MGHGHSDRLAPGEYGAVFEQFEDLEQQNESYVVGMWAFLVTEVMFFGALFWMYSLYRWKHQPYWYEVHKELHIPMGGLNTVILLTSSFTMAMAVYYAQHRQKRAQLMCLGATIACACGFLVVKFFEYKEKIAHHLLPGANFQWHNDKVPAGVAELFFSLYFAMTGLHGLHVIIGILIIGTLAILVHRDSVFVKNDYIPTELIGLYWHFVDLVWIFLFPLFYLMPQ
ncbi:MAG: cytochrome c oxidase subunit 3 [Chthonomonas sp.]|nr:cytochrome c oxidase subunit 3 [Chthonomonas sp.]